jgi:hypothetical protein
VTPKQAEKLTLASELGSLRLVLRHPGETPLEDEHSEATSIDSLFNDENEQTPRARASTTPTNQPGGSLLDLLTSAAKTEPSSNAVPLFTSSPTVVDHSIFVHGEKGVRVFDFQNGGERPVERDLNPIGSDVATGSAPFSQSSGGNQGSDSSDQPSFDDFSFGDAN